ncbi:MAG: hypothetical protein ACLU18_17085 [Bacteroides thetaiotaomicron]
MIESGLNPLRSVSAKLNGTGDLRYFDADHDCGKAFPPDGGELWFKNVRWLGLMMCVIMTVSPFRFG